MNYAKVLTDQLLIYVPKQGEAKPEQAATTLTASTAVTANKVNLNTATKEQLLQVEGIGDKKAAKIIEYRQQHGLFKNLSELKDIAGIGDKTYQKLVQVLTI